MIPNQWTRSSFCSTGACLAARFVDGGEGGMVQVADSKHPDGPALSFGADEWRAFIDAVKASGL